MSTFPSWLISAILSHNLIYRLFGLQFIPMLLYVSLKRMPTSSLVIISFLSTSNVSKNSPAIFNLSLWYRSYAGIHLDRSGGIHLLIEFLLLISILLLIIQSLVKWQNHRHQRHKHRRTYHRHQSLRGWGCGDCRKFLFLFF